jgi:lactate dehydrogenase-like 2-hydroxyacid dehydrogenase
MKPKIYVTRLLPQPAMEKLQDYFDLSVNTEDRVLAQAEIQKNIKGKDALLCLLTDTIDKAIMDSCEHLKVISNYAVGFNNIDIQEATRRAIPVCNTPGILTETTADLTFALIFSIARRIVESDNFLRAGKFKGWGPMDFLGTDIYGKTLGIIGMGRIGQAVAERARGFKMNILYTAHSDKQIAGTQFVSLTELLTQSDFVSIHLPLSPETRYLIGLNELKGMKKSAYLINTSRGPIVNEQELVYALQNNIIAGAGLDVYENEPLLTPGLVELNNTVLLPHIGSATIETRTAMGIMAAENAISIFKGEFPHSIANPEVLSIPARP